MSDPKDIYKFIITKQELVEFSFQPSYKKRAGRIADLIDEVISKLPEDLKTEAQKLNTLLIPENNDPHNRFAIPYKLYFEDASRELKEYIDKLWVRFTILPD
jgi:hypothetical protein